MVLTRKFVILFFAIPNGHGFPCPQKYNRHASTVFGAGGDCDGGGDGCVGGGDGSDGGVGVDVDGGVGGRDVADGRALGACERDCGGGDAAW